MWVDTSGVGVGATARRRGRRPQPTVCVPKGETVCLFDKEILFYSMTKPLFLVEEKLYYAPEQATGLGSLDGSPGA